MSNNNIEHQIIFFRALIQTGLAQNRTDAELDIFLGKLIGTLPLGADAPTFESRKRLITAHCLSKFLFTFYWVIFFFLLSGTFATFVWAMFPDIYDTLIFGCITIFCFSGLIYSLKKAKQWLSIFTAIRQTKQMQPDLRAPSHPILDLNTLAITFSRQRLKTRIIGLFISTLSGAILYWLYIAPPEKILGIACLFPFFFMMGIGCIFCPISKAESLYLYGTAKLPWQHMPALFKLCIFIGVIASILMLMTLELSIVP